MQKQELALCRVNSKRFGFARFDSGDPKYCFIDLNRQWLLQNVLSSVLSFIWIVSCCDSFKLAFFHLKLENGDLLTFSFRSGGHRGEILLEFSSNRC